MRADALSDKEGVEGVGLFRWRHNDGSRFRFLAADGEYQLNCFPGFDRWEHDLVAVLKEVGGILRETPDVYITKIKENEESPILAVEFCSALPAGN